MTWEPAGKKFWRTTDGRFDKLQVVNSDGSYFRVYDWDYGKGYKCATSEEANRWCESRRKSFPDSKLTRAVTLR